MFVESAVSGTDKCCTFDYEEWSELNYFQNTYTDNLGLRLRRGGGKGEGGSSGAANGQLTKWWEKGKDGVNRLYKGGGNLGVILDVTGKEWIGVALIFDSGRAFYFDADKSDMLRDRLYSYESNPFSSIPARQLAMVEDVSW